MDVKILKFTTQITRAHAHHQGRARRAGHKFWSVCATKVATKCSTAKSTSTCSMPAMLSAFHNSNISLTETFWRLCKRVELNLECLPRGQARLRERPEIERERKIGEIVCLSRIARPPAARAIMCRAASLCRERERGRPRAETGLWPKPTPLKRGTQEPDRSGPVAILTKVHRCGDTDTGWMMIG